MKEKKISPQLTQSEGFALMAEYFRSGMGAAEFYRSKNISEWRFYRWRQLYLQAHPDAVHQKAVSENRTSAFHPLEITGKPSICVFPSFEIVYPTGVTLRIDEGVTDVSLVRELINF